MYKILLIENVKQKKIIKELHNIIKELNDEIKYQNIKIKSLTNYYMIDDNSDEIIHSTNDILKDIFEFEKEDVQGMVKIEENNDENEEMESSENIEDDSENVFNNIEELKIYDKTKKRNKHKYKCVVCGYQYNCLKCKK